MRMLSESAATLLKKEREKQADRLTETVSSEKAGGC